MVADCQPWLLPGYTVKRAETRGWRCVARFTLMTLPASNQLPGQWLPVFHGRGHDHIEQIMASWVAVKTRPTHGGVTNKATGKTGGLRVLTQLAICILRFSLMLVIIVGIVGYQPPSINHQRRYRLVRQVDISDICTFLCNRSQNLEAIPKQRSFRASLSRNFKLHQPPTTTHNHQPLPTTMKHPTIDRNQPPALRPSRQASVAHHEAAAEHGGEWEAFLGGAP